MMLCSRQLPAIAKEAQKMGLKIAPLVVVQDNFASVAGFLPGTSGAPTLPVVSNHQSAFLAVSLATTNITNSVQALKSSDNGSVVVRKALSAIERVVTTDDFLFRPGQKPVAFVRSCFECA
jgi:hypothetical protein